MRKRIVRTSDGKKYVKAATAAGNNFQALAPRVMRKPLFLIITVMCFLCSSCTTSNAVSEEHSPAWLAYCDKYDVSVDEPTSDQVDYYLDVWIETDEASEYMEGEGIAPENEVVAEESTTTFTIPVGVDLETYKAYVKYNK